MSNKTKLGGMSKLSQLSGIKPQASEKETEDVSTSPQLNENSEISSESNPKSKDIVVKEDSEKLVAINIKIPKTQKDWLTHKAIEVRDNKDKPVPPGERVYPQHLIRVAIELLENADIDWSRVRNIEELREQLNL
jgi:hypothetical protein